MHTIADGMRDAVQWTIADGMKDAIKMPSVLPGYNFDDESQDDSCQSQIDYYLTGLTEEMVSDLRANQIVTEAGFREQSNKLTALGLLQFALLTTEPFNFEGTLNKLSHMVQNVRRSNKPQYTCKDRATRAKLLESLARALVSCQDHFPRASTVAYWFLQLQRHTEEVIGTVHEYLDLKEQRIIVRTPGVKGKGPRRSKVEQACKTIAEVIDSITREDYEEIERHRPIWKDGSVRHMPTRSLSDHDVKLELLEEMERCFRAFGPRKFLQIDTDHAIAEILREFGMEEGDRSTIVERNRRALSRKDARHQQDSE